jgi:SNF2 family DNA or RNA helicase
MGVGTGKTLTGLRLLLKPCLILCRRDDYLTWLKELASEGVPEDRIFVVETGADDLPEIAPAWAESNPDEPGSGYGSFVDYTLCTWDMLRNDRILSWIYTQPFECVLGDEAQSIKRSKSERTKRAIKATRHIPCRVPMTGSVITNQLSDVFSICKFADDGKTFGKSEWDFMNRYYLKEGPAWYPRHDAKDQIARKLSNVMYHVATDDVLNLPDAEPIIKCAELSAEQRRLYDQIVNDWELEMENGETMWIDMATTRLEKLKQIASGFYYDDNPKELGGPAIHELKCPKLDLMISHLFDRDILGETKKIVIWASHRPEIERIISLINESCYLGEYAVEFHGGMKRKDRDEARQLFLTHSPCRFFIGSVDMGVGMNELMVANTAVYFSNSHKVQSRTQSEGRIRRRGSEQLHNRIFYYDYVTEGTVDELVMRNLNTAISIASYVLRQIKRGEPLRRLIRPKLPQQTANPFLKNFSNRR